MMKSEFIDRTGYEPDANEYHLIEMAYYDFDGNKDQFCAHWLKEKKAGRWDRERDLLARRDYLENHMASERDEALRQMQEIRQNYETLIQNYYEPELQKLQKRVEYFETEERIRKNANAILTKFLQCGA